MTVMQELRRLQNRGTVARCVCVHIHFIYYKLIIYTGATTFTEFVSEAALMSKIRRK